MPWRKSKWQENQAIFSHENNSYTIPENKLYTMPELDFFCK